MDRQLNLVDCQHYLIIPSIDSDSMIFDRRNLEIGSGTRTQVINTKFSNVLEARRRTQTFSM